MHGGLFTPYDSNTSPLNFSIAGRFDEIPGAIRQTPTGIVVGRFSTGHFEITITNGVGKVALTLVGPFDNGNTFSGSATGSVVQSQTSCVPVPFESFGVFFVFTNLTVQLPQLGRTDISVWNWVPCTI
jgi:hypothetical protein